MKTDKALLEVWEWKEEVAKETAGMSFQELVAYEKKTLDEFEKKYHIQLRFKVQDK